MKLNLNHFTMMSIIILFCSCASTTQFTKFAGTEKLESTSEARIYVLRPSYFGSAVKMKVFCNDKLIGRTGPASFLSWEVKEGEYIIKSSAENKDHLTVNAEGGKTYYIKQIPKIGWVLVRVSLKSLDEHQGELILGKLKNPKLGYGK